MKTLAPFLISVLLVTFVYAGSPTISLKSKKQIQLDTFAFNLQKSFNTMTGETLVSWIEDSGGVEAALINPKGKLIGKPFFIVEAQQAGTCCFYGSSITYNPAVQEYFATYSPEKTGTILAVRLDRLGNIIGKEITILPGISPPKPNDLGDNSFPHVIFNPKTNGYTLIWERTEGIAAALVDQSGKVTSPIKIVKKNPGSNGFYDDQRSFDGRIQDVQWLASGKKLLVVFQQRFADQPVGGQGQADDWLAVLDPLLKRSPKTRQINTTPFSPLGSESAGGGAATLGILPDDSACVFYADNDIVRARTINRRGRFTSEPFAAFSGVTDIPLHHPTVAFSTTSKGTVGLLIAFQLIPFGVVPSNIWAQVLDDHGQPAGKAKVVYTVVNELWVPSAVNFALPGKPSDSTYRFVWLNPYDGILKLKLQVTP